MELLFSNPSYLWTFAFVPFLFLFHFYTLRYMHRRALKFANFEALKRVSGGYAISKNFWLLFLRLLVFSMLVLAISGATFWYQGKTADTDTVIALDASGSMLADDFSPNRLEAAKNAAKIFVADSPPHSQIAVLAFSGMSFIEETLTEDKSLLNESISNIDVKSMSGTAIAESLKTSANLLVLSQRAKRIILITDGQENVASSADVSKVLDYVKKNHITVYTIGVGTEQGGKIPGTEAASTIDEKLLNTISNITDGVYFRVTDLASLEDSFSVINQAEQGKISVELDVWLMIACLVALFLEWTLINSRYRSLP